jgi:hypothetical protein
MFLGILKMATSSNRKNHEPAVFMSIGTFVGSEDSSIGCTGEYTIWAFINAAKAWAVENDGPEAEHVMDRALLFSGITAEHIEGSHGYIASWSAYIRRLYKSVGKGFTLLTPDRAEDLVDMSDVAMIYDRPSPDPLFKNLEIIPRITFNHRVTIDGVRWSVEELLNSMSAIEDCASDWGGESLHGGGRQTILAELLERHAGLTSRGGYHSSPHYDDAKWTAFRARLESFLEIK